MYDLSCLCMRRRFLLYVCIVMIICGSLGFQVGLYVWHVPPAFPRPAEKQRETFVEEHHVAPPKQTLLQTRVKEYVPPSTTCAKKCLTHLRAYYNHYYGKDIVYERTEGCNIVFREGVGVSRMNVSAYEAIEHAVNRIDGNTAICMINKCDSQLFEQRAKDIWWIGNEQGAFHLDRTKKFAYVWWTSISEYTWSAIVAIKSLKSMNPDKQIDFVLIHTITLSNEQQQILDTYGVKCISFKNTVHVRNSYFKYANNKLYVFKLTQYDRVLFMDFDSMPLRNMDHMFMFPDAPIVAPCSYWEPEQQPKLTDWIMLIQPSIDSFDKLLKRAKEIPTQADIQTLNDVFRDEMLLLPSYYGLLNSEWERGDKTYHLHGDSIFEQAPIVHYTIKGKPWQHKKNFFAGSAWDIEANILHNTWWDLRKKMKFSKWYNSIRRFCKFDEYPWKDYNLYEKKLTFVFDPSIRSQGIGQGLVGLSFAMYLSLQSHRRLQIDWRQGGLFIENWSTPTSKWKASHKHGTPYPIWNFGRTESANKMVQLLLSNEPEVVISGNSIKEKLPAFRKLFRHNIWESDNDAIRICRACAFPFLFDDDVDVEYENVLHLRLGDSVAYGFGSDRRKIMKLAHTIENAVDRGVELLGSGDIFVESDSERAKTYASKTYSNVHIKSSMGHTGTSSATLKDMKEMWQVILRMAAADNILYTQSALSEAAVSMGAGVLTNAMRFENRW